MIKRLIMGSLIVCCIILVTAKGSVLARRLGEDKNLNVHFASEHYNMKIYDEKIELNDTNLYFGLDYKNKSINDKPGDCLQGLIMAPMVIMKTIGDNPVIISRQELN